MDSELIERVEEYQDACDGEYECEQVKASPIYVNGIVQMRSPVYLLGNCLRENERNLDGFESQNNDPWDSHINRRPPNGYTT